MRYRGAAILTAKHALVEMPLMLADALSPNPFHLIFSL